jgi:hypothetical protein
MNRSPFTLATHIRSSTATQLGPNICQFYGPTIAEAAQDTLAGYANNRSIPILRVEAAREYVEAVTESLDAGMARQRNPGHNESCITTTYNPNPPNHAGAQQLQHRELSGEQADLRPNTPLSCMAFSPSTAAVRLEPCLSDPSYGRFNPPHKRQHQSGTKPEPRDNSKAPNSQHCTSARRLRCMLCLFECVKTKTQVKTKQKKSSTPCSN